MPNKLVSILIFIFLLAKPAWLERNDFYYLALFWNVGQGQWITVVTPDQCLHFDFGGEFQYFNHHRSLLLKLCQRKINPLYLTHPDYDHYAYYKQLVRLLPKICWAEIDHTPLPEKMTNLKIPLCLEKSLTGSRPFVNRIFKPNKNFSPKKLSKNDQSIVYQFASVLIPGDSTKKMENKWAPLLTHHKIKILSVGHHGSRTSTSPRLLQHLPQLKQAIVQARQKKYGHPSLDTRKVLNSYRIPVLKTEDWGNIGIFLN